MSNEGKLTYMYSRLESLHQQLQSNVVTERSTR